MPSWTANRQSSMVKAQNSERKLSLFLGHELHWIDDDDAWKDDTNVNNDHNGPGDTELKIQENDKNVQDTLSDDHDAQREHEQEKEKEQVKIESKSKKQSTSQLSLDLPDAIDIDSNQLADNKTTGRRTCGCKCCYSIVNVNDEKYQNNLQMWERNEKTGQIRFTEERDYHQISEKNKNKQKKSHCKWFPLCPKIQHIISDKIQIFCRLEALKAMVFYSFILLFILSDLIVRVIPLIMFHVVLNVYFSTILAYIVSFLMMIVILVVQFLVIYDWHVHFVSPLKHLLQKCFSKQNEAGLKDFQRQNERQRKNNTNETNIENRGDGVEFIILFSGLITSSYYFWSLIGLDYLQCKFTSKMFLKQQYYRIVISTLIVFTVVIIQIGLKKWHFLSLVIFYAIVLFIHLLFVFGIHLNSDTKTQSRNDEKVEDKIQC